MPQEPNVFKYYVPGRLLILPSFELVLSVVAAVVVAGSLGVVVAVVVLAAVAVVVAVAEQALGRPAPDFPAIKVLLLRNEQKIRKALSSKQLILM